jgi:hypothetical protein
MSKSRYKLKAMLTSERTIMAASAQRFVRIPGDYILLYTDKKVDGAIDMPQEGFAKLTDEDRIWLRDCITVIAIENGLKNKANVEENNNAFMSAFEAELQKERERVSGGEESADGE